MARTTLRFVGVLAQAGFSVLASVAFAEDCTSPVGTLVSVQGSVEVQRSGATDWRPIGLGGSLCAGDVLRIGERSRIEASLVNQVKIRGDQNTTLKLISAPEERISWLDLFSGGAYFFSRQPRSLNVNTPFVNAAVEGTEFQIRVVADHTDIGVFNGSVLARNSFGEATLRSGRSSIATAYAAPTDVLTIRPFDAVQWALYFPPVLASPPADLALPMALREAIELADQGRTAEAFQRFAKVPDADRDATFYLYRAQTLLSVGRVDEAEADLRQVLARDPDNALAYGVLAVIAVSRNEQADALRLAQHAVELAPSSAAAKIALSYAEQSRFQIEAARDALQQAVADEPENALAWARLSELWLMLGWRDRAVETAKRARDLAPDLGRVQTVLGFAALAEINTRRAAEAFRRAIELDQASPLPRFGLGLATIRDGNLREGRADIESAVLLDPNNSLLRSYLGKAYFEERTTNPLEYFRELIENFPNQENKHAAEQYALAKKLDPNDPTPWFYDAIRKQSENRPVEALQDLQKSIELNDNRAVFRSRELLDQDRAARGASLARIYNDLGFEQLGINEATTSLSYDPANAGAHRFLSDTYMTLPRREAARVSELLQAQLLQDININPVQPSLSITNLGIISPGGPARPGFNEFTPLFDRNQAQLNLSSVVGSDWTRGEEVVVSGIYDNVSISAGQWHYQSDGFRRNFDIERDAYDVFAQAAVTPEFNVQGELRRWNGENGDRELQFDRRVNSPDFRQNPDEFNARLGARYSLSPSSDILASIIYSDRTFRDEFGDLDTGVFGSHLDDRGMQYEAQYIYRHNDVNVIIGTGYYELDRRFSQDETLRDETIGSAKIDGSINQANAYVYSSFKILPSLLATIGVGYDYYQEKPFGSPDVKARKLSKERVNPKVGLQWQASENVAIRSAVYRTVNRALVTNQTIEPTQIAGFNQVYDALNGTDAWNYALGVDIRLSDAIFAGMEWVSRKTNSFAFRIPYVDTLQRDEEIFNTYLYWALTDKWVVTANFVFDTFDASTTPQSVFPARVETFSIPITVKYFTPLGFFAGFGISFVDQDVNIRNNTASDRQEGNAQFVSVDAGIGYRLPDRRGLIVLQGRNLANNKFAYRDDNYRNPETPFLTSIIPERSIFLSTTVNF